MFTKLLNLFGFMKNLLGLGDRESFSYSVLLDHKGVIVES